MPHATRERDASCASCASCLFIYRPYGFFCGCNHILLTIAIFFSLMPNSTRY
ncbi:hypothetical protein B0O99DRAFT_608339 [Bisporella sp. PMI_857]|nr:hypothetical protein B0O99DRAFT_608339 [Bisporella sp. PMI_857]